MNRHTLILFFATFTTKRIFTSSLSFVMARVNIPRSSPVPHGCQGHYSDTRVRVFTNNSLHTMLYKPLHIRGGRHGYAGWDVALERTLSSLYHTTRAEARFTLAVIHNINYIYAERAKLKDNIYTNRFMRRSLSNMSTVDDLFHTGGNWRGQLPKRRSSTHSRWRPTDMSSASHETYLTKWDMSS